MEINLPEMATYEIDFQSCIRGLFLKTSEKFMVPQNIFQICFLLIGIQFSSKVTNCIL